MQHTDDPDRGMVVIVWCVVAARRRVLRRRRLRRRPFHRQVLVKYLIRKDVHVKHRFAGRMSGESNG